MEDDPQWAAWRAQIESSEEKEDAYTPAQPKPGDGLLGLHIPPDSQHALFMEFLRKHYEELDNPMLFWPAWMAARAAGGVPPEWMLRRLDKMANDVFTLYAKKSDGMDKRPYVDASLKEIFGFLTKGGKGDQFYRFDEWRVRQYAYSVYKQCIDGNGKPPRGVWNKVADAVAEKFPNKNVDHGTVRRWIKSGR